MTEDEARDKIIEAARHVADYWSGPHPAETPMEDRVRGALFSFLVALDGGSGLPGCDVVMVHHDEEGDPVGETRVSTQLHEFFYGEGWPRA